MLIQIPHVLTAEQVEYGRELLDAASWVDGRVTAGHQSAMVKHNLQLPEDSPAVRELGDLILAALQNNPLFVADRKFESGTGWPSFFAPLEGAVGTSADDSLFMRRRVTAHPRDGFPEGDRTD